MPVTGMPFAIFLRVGEAVPLDLYPHLRRQAVDHGSADAVEASRDLIGAAAEFGPCVESGHHRLEGRPARGGVHVYRYSPAVVRYANLAVLLDGYPHHRAVARHGLVYTVVHHFVDQVLKPTLVGAPDVHPRPPAYRFKPLQNLDIFGCVL